MKNLKGILLIGIALVFSSLLVACSTKSDSIKSEKEIESVIERNIIGEKDEGDKTNISKDRKTIVFIGKTEGDKFLNSISASVENVCKTKKYNFLRKTVKDSSQMVNEQKRILQELIVAKVDGIIIVPSSPTELIPILKKVKDANIPIVIVDSALDSNEAKKYGVSDIPFITIDSTKAEYDAVKFVVDKMKASKTVIKPIIIAGDLSGINAVQRRDGAIKILKENNVTPLGVEDGKWRVSQGYKIANKYFKQFNDINLIVCGNDEMALGAFQCVDELNKKDVMILGFDAGKKALEYVKNGKMTLTVKQDSENIGKTAVETVIELMNGKKTTGVINIPTQILNKDNIN